MGWLKRNARILKRAGIRWWDDDAHQIGAALAYYSLFSAAPILIIAMAIAGVAFDAETVRTALERRLAGAIGPQPARTLLDLAVSRMERADGFWAAAIAGGALIFLSIALFVELRVALARIWKRDSKAGPSGFARVVRSYAIAVLMVIGAGILLLGLLALSAVLGALKSLGADLPGTAVFLRLLNIAVPLAVAVLVFALVFRVTSHFAWRHIWRGALVTALLYTLGNTLFGFYIEVTGMRSGYGAAGALVVFLVWVYYTAQIFIYGAEAVAASAEDAAQFTARWRGV
jgi:membrane protein